MSASENNCAEPKAKRAKNEEEKPLKDFSTFKLKARN
jgi:hypothetical protein